MSSAPGESIVQPSIFREYIGYKSLVSFPVLSDFPADIINEKLQEFHFILAFASEQYDEKTKQGTGNFYVNWNIENFGKKNAKKLKHAFKDKDVKVKLIISIGGRGDEYPFNPAFEIQRWVGNATNTLTDIIADFKNYCQCDLIDGIDIHYESIEPSAAGDFPRYIGELIKSLKGLTEKDPDIRITVASIAPSEPVKDSYMSLYRNYRNIIDWVDYKFYQQKEKLNEQTFLKLYHELTGEDYYSDKKLLAGFSTDPSDQVGQISQKDFINGCTVLLGGQSLPGICVWDAEDSSASENNIDNKPYEFENEAQTLLVDHHHPDYSAAATTRTHPIHLAVIH